MSLLFKNDLEEYARQCTLQRRQYEACVQQARQDTVNVDPVQATTQSFAARVKEPIGVPQAEKHVDAIKQSCLLELLEIDIEPLAWQDECQSLAAIRQRITTEQNSSHDRSQKALQAVTNATGKSASCVSYGAP